MSSDVVIKDKKHTGSYSRMAIAMQQVAGKINTEPNGLYDQQVTIKTDCVTIKNDDLDMEFSIPFDDDTEANEAEIIIYNLTDATINAIQKNAPITVTAGYGKDVGVIFSGYVSTKETHWEDSDKKTTIHAIDNNGKKETELTELSFGAGAKASSILRKLVGLTGLPIAAFEVKRDHTYKDGVKVSGGLMENIKKYAQICGVTAYMCKSKMYVCPLTYGTHDVFYLTPDTGLLSYSGFEETNSSENYKDYITGQNIEMLLQHKVQTGSVINLSAKQAKGDYRVREGTHTYNGSEFTTSVTAVSYSSIIK